MKAPCLFSLFAAAALAVTALPARAEEAPTTAKFSDPSKPGTFKVVLAHGELRVTGADTNEVSVRTDSRVTNKPRKDGMRVLTASTSFSLSEKENVITLDAMADGWGGGGAGDFRVTVPRNTSVVVQSAWGGDIVCTSLTGDIDIKSTNGEVRLDDVAGGVTVETMNGEVRANLREVRESKPVSFSSTNGQIILSVPPETKANIRLRTQNGAVLTNFEDNVLVTKTETTTRPASGSRRGRSFTTTNGDKLREAAREMEAKARAMAADIARGGADADHIRAEADKMRAEAEKMRAEADKMRTEVRTETRTETNVVVATAPTAPTPPTPPTPSTGTMPAMPAMPAVPTITGGKLVTGTLNGGGPEISIATMNGDVTLRKLEATPANKK